MAIDPGDPSRVYVAAPIGLGASPGTNVWSSRDGGRSFGKAVPIAVTSGDSDIDVLRDGTVMVISLNVAGSEVCVSKDHGLTFSEASGGPCGSGVVTESGPDSDRPWLLAGTHGEMYQTYSDFVAETLQIHRSDDSGRTFLPCGLIQDVTTPAGTQYVNQGTAMGKPVVSARGGIVVPFRRNSNTGVRNPINGDYTAQGLHVATSPRDEGCPSGPGITQFSDHLVYEDPGARLGHTFDTVAVGADGTIYVVTSGRITAASADLQLYLFSSTDAGRTWTRPVRVNAPGLRSNVFPVVLAGRRPGQIAVGWLGSTGVSGGSETSPDWRFYAAESRDSGRTFGAPYRTGVVHSGCIRGSDSTACTERRLLDFATGVSDPRTGRYIFAVPTDGGARPGHEATRALVLSQRM